MRKFTLVLLVALIASATSWAQDRKLRLTKELPVAATAQKEAPRMSSRQRQTSMDRMLGSHMAMKVDQKSKVIKPESGAKKRIARGTITGNEDVITEQPAGTKVIYSRSGSAYYPSLFGVYGTQVIGALGTIVFGDNNEIYIKNIISQYATDSWFKGTINGDKVSINFPQKAFSYEGEDYYVDLLKYDEANRTYASSAELTTLELNYNASTKAITTPLRSDFFKGDLVIGLVDSESAWVGYADFNMSYTVMTDVPVEAPEGLETTTYSVTADGFEGTLAEVGFVGDEIYIQGIFPNLPDNWIKGTISGNKATFKSGQYIGPDEVLGYHQYLVSATAEQLWDDWYEEWYTEYSLSTDDITFDFDPAAKTLSNSSPFLVNAGTTEVNYAAVYDKAELKPFKEVAATPASPVWNEVFEGGYPYYSSGYGWGYLSFNVETKDVDGNYILPDKLSYIIYTKVNGEVKELELSYYDYYYQEEPTMVEIPYSYTDNYDIEMSNNSRNVWIYVIGPEEFGLQTVYRGAGEERRSEIVWEKVAEYGTEIQPDAATPAYPDIDPDNVGGDINYGYYTGDEELSSFGEVKPQTYDVAIKIDNPDLEGTYIKSITFPLQDLTGISGISAWISSQLRVEDGKNAPDLANISVSPTEPGFITVNLEKPYVIPAGGVYVGYTLTVDQVLNEEAAYPVILANSTNEGGFFMRSSNGFLKWMDMTVFEGFSNCSAAIQVTVSGSKVKGNAASPLDCDNIYVLTNTPLEIDVDIVNHGSNGISSLDLEYTLNGTTNTQHIDLSEPVEGFFGKTYTTKLNIPAISESGNYDLKVKVTKVNGEDNGDAVAESTIPLIALKTLPKHRTLLEEYTGTWCGWCPRGFVALEKLAKEYPDDFILVSYHNDDPMEIMSYYFFPSQVEGFPTSFVDRKFEVDPYYGTSDDTPFGVKDDLALRSKEFGQASIEVTPSWGADGESIEVTTEVIFPYDLDNNKYALEYILVADGLTGAEGSNWDQSNYYSGGDDGEDMKQFNEGGSKVSGLVFNDVAVLMSEIGGIEGSLPTTIKANDPLTHSYKFNLSDAVNTSDEPIIQDKNKLRVIALLIDTETGEVVNANKADVGEYSSINGVSTSQDKITSISFYDITGRRMDKAQHGMNIIKVTYADGSQKTIKVLKK